MLLPVRKIYVLPCRKESTAPFCKKRGELYLITLHNASKAIQKLESCEDARPCQAWLLFKDNSLPSLLWQFELPTVSLFHQRQGLSPPQSARQ